jgi:prepilin-type N-terminal cleavage/methylation domain-containing protein/prepilin-type processing-associated H-X9-DG protein
MHYVEAATISSPRKGCELIVRGNERRLSTIVPTIVQPKWHVRGDFPMSRCLVRAARGVTLLETIVVIAIIGLALSVFLPAIVASRQKTQLASCGNNLRQLAQGWIEHEQSLGYYPSSGWGWAWTGDPDRGFGSDQPGGWAFDTLAFTSYAHIRELGAGMPYEKKGVEMTRAHQTPIPTHYCPGRRSAALYPPFQLDDAIARNLPECRSAVGRIDYAANSGNLATGDFDGPVGDRRRMAPPPGPYVQVHTGVTHQLSEIRVGQVIDGTSKTLCIAEKYLNPADYSSGSASPDARGAYVGMYRGVNRYTASAAFDGEPNPSYLPRQDRPGLSLNFAFGSAHVQGFNAAFCDGSVRFLKYTMDPQLFWALGGRNDSDE